MFSSILTRPSDFRYHTTQVVVSDLPVPPMPQITSEQVSELKRRLATAKEIASVMEFFFDEFTSRPEFLAAGIPRPVPEVVAETVDFAVTHALKQSNSVLAFSTVELPEFQLLHGTVVVNGKLGVLLWASDIQTGILSLPAEIDSPETCYMRLSVFPDPKLHKVN